MYRQISCFQLLKRSFYYFNKPSTIHYINKPAKVSGQLMCSKDFLLISLLASPLFLSVLLKDVKKKIKKIIYHKGMTIVSNNSM